MSMYTADGLKSTMLHSKLTDKFKRGFLEGYIAAATSEVKNNEGGEIGLDTSATLLFSAMTFLLENAHTLAGIGEKYADTAGTHLFFTDMRHGDGFFAWPEVYGEDGAQLLHAAANERPQLELYRGDDGYIYIV